MDKVKLAIVGCGAISNLNVPGYLDHNMCEIVALCDPVSERAISKAKEWGINPEIFTEYSDVLLNTDVDAIELLTPTYLHAEQIMAGIKAGKHISCQKPLATSMKEASEIKEVVTKSDLIFRVTENFLYYPPIVKAKQLIDSGEIGSPSLVRIRTIRGGMDKVRVPVETDTYLWRRDPKLNPGGMLYDDGWHKYATAMSWVGDIEKVTSIVTHNEDYIDNTPSAAVMKVKDKDCLVTLDYSSARDMPMRTKYYAADEFFEIVGPKGTIWVTRCTGEFLDMAPVVLIKGDHTTTFDIPSDWIHGFKGAAASFIESIINKETPDMDIDFSTKVLDIALSVYESSKSEKTIYTNTTA
ncbi:Gfo/Idh/MocA family oxidoreductase [SAR202 cluster bacterium AD-802-K11_MRT_200m]|nr:Gfo/Idh/MocA family oxidoreductase [SAR202 cluster bacterium AD-802-K11_MRT_200m]